MRVMSFASPILGDFNCCVSPINSELVVASKARDE